MLFHRSCFFLKLSFWDLAPRPGMTYTPSSEIGRDSVTNETEKIFITGRCDLWEVFRIDLKRGSEANASEPLSA